MDGVVKTASDAMACKQSLVSSGYAVRDSHCTQTSSTKRSPLTNRLYYARCSAVRRSVEMISSTFEMYQLLVLGCGHDNSYSVEHSSARIYYVDLPAIIPTCSSAAHTFDFSLPTIVILECVLGYLDPAANQKLLTELQRRISNCSIVLYDPIASQTSSYTTSLLTHFSAHNAALRSIYPTSYSLYSTLRDAGWRHILSMNMYQALELLCASAERRVQCSVEPFDEYAALAALHKIYHVSIISNNLYTFSSVLRCVHNGDSDSEKRNVRLQLFSQRLQYFEQYARAQLMLNALPPITIQQAQRSHLEGIIRLQKDNYNDLMKKYKAVSKYISRSIKQLESMLISPDCHMLVALIDERVVGCITLSLSKSNSAKIGVIGHLNVNEQYKRRGVASMLYEKLEQIANEASYQQLELTTLADLTPAICFYRSKGYETLKSEDIGLGCELVHMHKTLKII